MEMDKEEMQKNKRSQETTNSQVKGLKIGAKSQFVSICVGMLYVVNIQWLGKRKFDLFVGWKIISPSQG